jgi:ATP-dependent exoDNAse (exonuclease V) alpha subunit
MNKGKRWQTQENILMIKSLLNKNNILDISNDLGRSEYAIVKQLEKLLLNNGINMIEQYNNLLINNIIKNSDLLYKQLNYKDEIEEYPEINLLLNDMVNSIEETHDLNDEQLLCYNLAKSKKNLLITGSAGTGKSTILKAIISYYKRNNINIGITASTGIAATLINGITLHSYLKIGINNKPVDELYNDLVNRKNKKDYNKLLKLEVLIIDEISMIDNVLFSKIAAYLSLIKQIKKPFGNVQIILCGDFFQLPPINNTYCFMSKIWKKLKIHTIELKIQMRQIEDKHFQNILENIKHNNITDEIYEELEKLKYNKIDNDIKPTILYSKNIDIDKINNNEFNKLIKNYNYKTYIFPIEYDKENKKISNYIKKLDNTEITLCKGLQIMITHNIDINNKIVNGTRAIIKEIDYPNIIIQTINNQTYTISYVKYINEFDNDIEYNYIPIKLAYAISIHRSQGVTLDYIQLDLGDSIFEYGMSYVALSRAKKLNSICLTNLSRNAFKINDLVIEFHNSICN